MESELGIALAEELLLPDDLLRQLMSVGEVDFLVGISSHDPASAPAHFITSIEESVQSVFVRERVVIVNLSDGSKNGDGQVENVLENIPRKITGPGITSLRTIHRVTTDFSSQHPPGFTLRTILSAADLLRARACAVVSPYTSNFSPASIANLLKPVYKDKFDFVAPLYTRHKFQGLLARNLLYPMSHALFGCEIRELYSDEWGFSGRLATHCLNQNVWHEDAIKNRPEAWMAISALTSDFRCCQIYLGEKPQTTRSTPTDIVEVLRQTVGTLFWSLETYESLWLNSDQTRPAPTFGPPQELTSEPSSLDQHRIFEMFRTGVIELEPILASILDPETHAEIRNMVSLAEADARFRPDIWVRALYDFAAAYHHSVINRSHLIQALAPLYRGMTHSFLVEHASSSPAEIEATDEMLCSEFELQKPYLRERWKARVEVKS
jgi:glucosylglycerate synthase